MDRAGLITLEQARAAGLSFDEPEPRACPHCGAALEPLGAALAGRVTWVSSAPCPCEGADLCQYFGHKFLKNQAAFDSLPAACSCAVSSIGSVLSKKPSMASAGIL